MRLSTLLSASLLLSPALLAQRFPENEPNNTVGTAQAVAVGTQVDGGITPTDQDWYSFTLTAPTRIRIHTSSVPSTVLQHGDTRIALLDATGTTFLGIDDDARGATNGWTSDITLNIAAGSYTVLVVPFDGSVTGPYSLDIAEITRVVYDGSEIEPNDSHLLATPTGLLSPNGTRFLGNLGPNTVVFSGTVDTPVLPPTVDAGVSAPGSVVFSGSVDGSIASTTTTTRTLPLSQPMANPPLTSYVPGMHLRMTSGANIGLTRLISSNTATSIVTAAFPVANSGGDTFDIITVNTTTVTWVPALALASLYVGGSAYSLTMTSGANIGLSRPISANTGPSAFGSEITTTAFPVANGLGDTWTIDCTTNTTTVFRTLLPLVPGLYNPTTGGNTLGHYHVRFTSGANAGLDRVIQGNTVSSITMASITNVPAAGDTFVIEQVDADYYQVVLTDPFNALWFQINEGDAPWVYGHKWELYNSAGNALLPATSVQTPAFGTQSGTASNLAARSSQARVWPAGTYYIAVRNPVAAFAAAGTMPGGIVPTGNYMLELFAAPVGNAGGVSETEPVGGPNANNTAATATPIALGQTGMGNVTISTGTDPSDWWGPINITSPVTITFQVRRGATATPMIDSTLNLRDSAGNIVLTATGGNILDVPTTSTTGLHGRTTVTFYLSSQTYYAEVISPSTGVTQMGDYELQISTAGPAPYVLGSYATFAANGTCGTAPFPTLATQFSPGEVPALGSTFSRQLSGCPADALFLLMQGISTTLANGVTPLPYDLTPDGAPGCTINVDPFAITFMMADAAGVGEISTQLPGTVALRGFFWFEQAFVLNPLANALGVQVSNYARPLTGERTY